MTTLSKEEIVRKIVVGMRLGMGVQGRIPQDTLVSLRKEGEDLAEEMKDLDPFLQELIIGFHVQKGPGQLSQGNYDWMLDEAKKLFTAFNSPGSQPLPKIKAIAALAPEEREQYDSIIARTMIMFRLAMGTTARLQPGACANLRSMADLLAEKLHGAHPVVQELMIGFCGKRGDVPTDGIYDILFAESQTVLKALGPQGETQKSGLAKR